LAKIFTEKTAVPKREEKRKRRSAPTDEQKIARAEMELARLKTKARKLDTRRKVILGGGLIALARNGDENARQLLQQIVDYNETEAQPSPFKDWSWSQTGEA